MTNSRTLSIPSGETLLKFTNIVGEAHCVRAPEDMAPYLCEWRDRYHGAAAAVLRPGSTEEVSRILALANETRTAIVPQGGNTGLVGGQIPWESGNEIVLSLSRMDQILDVDAAGNTLTVQAGATLQAVQEAAEKVDRLFPLSLASEGSCQIGGNLATNAGGVGVLAYGNMRALTLGLEVVLADGRVWNGLRGLLKDNSGYDLRDLIVGSEGTLGIITSAVLKLFPRSEGRLTVMAGLPSIDQVTTLFERAQRVGLGALTAFELLPRIGLEFVIRHSAGRDPFAHPYPWHVLLEYSGTGKDEGLKTKIESLLCDLMECGVLTDAVVSQSEAQSADLWRLRETMSEAQKPEGGSIKHDVSVPIASIPAFISRADAVVQKVVPGARPVPFGHFGDGNIHYNVSQPEGMDKQAYLDHWDQMNEAVYGLALDLGGSISAEHGIGRMKRDLLARTKDPVALDVMRSVKQSLDPHGILNPGKVLSS